MKTRGSGKIPREDAILVQGVRTPAGDDTTSEPRGRNAPPGAPVIAFESRLSSSTKNGAPAKADGLCGEEEMQSLARMFSAGERSIKTFASTTYLLTSCIAKHSKTSNSLMSL